MKHYLQLIRRAVEAIAIESTTSHSWFGQPSPRLAPSVRQALTPDAARSYLISELRSRLYASFYVQGFADAGNGSGFAFSRTVKPDSFLDDLSAANTGTGGWEAGWTVRSVQGDDVVVEGRGLVLRAARQDCLVTDGGPVVGDADVSLRYPKELFRFSPGFYMALGDGSVAATESVGALRLYWHVTAEGSGSFVRRATEALNGAGLPFHLKVLDHPNAFGRCDAAVLYLPVERYEEAVEALAPAYSSLAPELQPRTPVFSKELAPGLGFAEDPLSRESFGVHRCRLIAEALVEAYEQRVQSVDARLDFVRRRFAEEGISEDRPYLNPDSTDRYDFPSLGAAVGGQVPRTERASDASSDARASLDTAAAIGRHLVDSATWYRDQCNWMERTALDPRAEEESSGGTYRALGPALYSGSAGVALFLGELYAATGDAEVRRTAIGAIRHALTHADALPPGVRRGLYVGTLGIAFAALRLGVLLKHVALVKSARRLARRVVRDRPNRQGFDLLSGRAGSIVAIIALNRLMEDTVPIGYAVELADELIEAADRTSAGSSWPDPEKRRRRNLTGFSHGASGIGFAVLELFRETGEARYCDMAEDAFRYERHWFDEGAGNWPDFRKRQVRGQARVIGNRFSIAWCHGAPGIALSRLRAYELLGDPAYAAEAAVALATTAAAVRLDLDARRGSLTLCHGLAGNAEVLLLGDRILPRSDSPTAKLVSAVARFVAEEYEAGRAPSFDGLDHNDAPGLMVGVAGLGYFQLRARDPEVPSMLLLKPECWGSRG